MQEFIQSYKDTQTKLKACPVEVSIDSDLITLKFLSMPGQTEKNIFLISYRSGSSLTKKCFKNITIVLKHHLIMAFNRKCLCGG